MKKAFFAVLLAFSFAQAGEIGTSFYVGQYMPQMKEAIRESYKKEGVSEELIKKIDLELYSIESFKSTSLLQDLDALEMVIAFSSSYVRDEEDGVADYCTVVMTSTATFGSASSWKVKEASCEAYD
jgi:hypothetical protein